MSLLNLSMCHAYYAFMIFLLIKEMLPPMLLLNTSVPSYVHLQWQRVDPFLKGITTLDGAVLISSWFGFVPLYLLTTIQQQLLTILSKFSGHQSDIHHVFSPWNVHNILFILRNYLWPKKIHTCIQSEWYGTFHADEGCY